MEAVPEANCTVKLLSNTETKVPVTVEIGTASVTVEPKKPGAEALRLTNVVPWK